MSNLLGYLWDDRPGVVALLCPVPALATLWHGPIGISEVDVLLAVLCAIAIVIGTGASMNWLSQ